MYIAQKRAPSEMDRGEAEPGSGERSPPAYPEARVCRKERRTVVLDTSI